LSARSTPTTQARSATGNLQRSRARRRTRGRHGLGHDGLLVRPRLLPPPRGWWGGLFARTRYGCCVATNRAGLQATTLPSPPEWADQLLGDLLRCTGQDRDPCLIRTRLRIRVEEATPPGAAATTAKIRFVSLRIPTETRLVRPASWSPRRARATSGFGARPGWRGGMLSVSKRSASEDLFPIFGVYWRDGGRHGYRPDGPGGDRGMALQDPSGLAGAISSGSAGYAVRMVGSGGSELVIFVPRATHSHDLV
jgi:hypothetical protein